MQLVNWQGALIGPGSEWFWSMLQFVIVAGTLIGLYRQLRIQSNQGAVEQLNSFDREWDSERFTRHKLEVFVALRKGAHRAELPFAAAMTIANFFERIATLSRSAHLDQSLLARDSGDRIRLWWFILEPFAGKIRDGQPRFLVDLEWLAGVIAGLERKTGTETVYDNAFLGLILERQIAGYEDQLKIDQELRTVTVASTAVEAAATPAAPLPATAAP